MTIGVWIDVGKGYATLIDREDQHYFFNRRWYCSMRGRKECLTPYVVSTDFETEGHPQLIFHRHILQAPTNLVVDHINGDSLDNRRSNLRLCTKQQNNQNRHKNKWKGVTFSPIDKRWRAFITHDGKYISLKTYDKPIEAAKAYNEAALKYFGEFACLNDLSASSSYLAR